MYKDNTLTISYDTWKYGIATSPYAGNGDMRNLDPHSKPGALLCGKAAVADTFAPTDIPRNAVYYPEDNVFFVGADDGEVYKRSSGGSYSNVTGTLSESDCLGLDVWRDHLIHAGDTDLNLYDISADSWDDGWQSFSNGRLGGFDVPHTMLVGTDDVVYICDGDKIASLQEVSGQVFDPSNAATYTWNATALDLPENYIANTLLELGTYLVIGCYFHPSQNRGNIATSFPWDRVSDSFNIPLTTNGNGVQQSIQNGNSLYSIIDRNKPRIYASNLSSFELQRELQFLDVDLDLHPDAVEMINEELYFGLGSNDSDSSRLGVYSIKNDLLQLRHTISEGDSQVEIGSVTTNGDRELLITWKNEDTDDCGADFVSDTYVSSYGAFLETQLFQVGTAHQKKQFKNLVIDLGKDLATGEGVQISYRENTSDSYTELGTYDFTSYDAVSAIHATVAMPQLSNVQLKVALTSSGTTTPELLSVSLY